MPKDPFDLFLESMGKSIKSALYRGPENEIPSALYDFFQSYWKDREKQPLIIDKVKVKSTAHMEKIEELIKDGIEEFPNWPDEPKKERPKLPPKKEPKYKPTESIIKRAKKALDLPDHITPKDIATWIQSRPKKRETWYLVIHLPGEISYDEFCSKLSNFETAVGGWVEISKIGRAVYMKATNVLLKRVIPYMFDPLEYEDLELPILVGYDAQGPIVLDLAEAISILIAGLRNYGKSVLIMCIIYSLLLQNRDPLNPKAHIILIDTEVGEYGDFEPYGPLWITEHVDALKVFLLMDEEAKRRKKIIMRVANNLVDYRSLGHKDIPYIVFILDELGGLGMFHDFIYRILKEYRKWGIIVVGATQRPSKTMWDKFKRDSWMDAKSQFGVRIGFKMIDEINSRMIFDTPRCAHLPAKLPGRAILFWDSETEMQVPYFPGKKNRRKLQEYLSRLQPVPLPYEDIKGEVYEDEPKYPLSRSEARSKSSRASRTDVLLNAGTNPFA